MSGGGGATPDRSAILRAKAIALLLEKHFFIDRNWTYGDAWCQCGLRFTGEPRRGHSPWAAHVAEVIVSHQSATGMHEEPFG